MPCFWCSVIPSKALTRDHVVPVMFGGEFIYPNVVMACEDCNSERGEIPQYVRQIQQLTQRIEKWHRRMYRLRRRLKKKMHWVLMLQRKWTAIENEKWGSSPSSKIEITLPKIVKSKPKSIAQVPAPCAFRL